MVSSLLFSLYPSIVCISLDPRYQFEGFQKTLYQWIWFENPIILMLLSFPLLLWSSGWISPLWSLIHFFACQQWHQLWPILPNPSAFLSICWWTPSCFDCIQFENDLHLFSRSCILVIGHLLKMASWTKCRLMTAVEYITSLWYCFCALMKSIFGYGNQDPNSTFSLCQSGLYTSSFYFPWDQFLQLDFPFVCPCRPRLSAYSTCCWSHWLAMLAFPKIAFCRSDQPGSGLWGLSPGASCRFCGICWPFIINSNKI